MPGAVVYRGELHDAAVAPDEEVGRDPQPRQAGKPGMGAEVEPVQEEIGHIGAAELAGRQGDVVHDQ